MRARYLLPVIFPLIAFSQKVDFEKIELGKRNDKYRVWIYFTDKKGSQQITLSPKTIKRRIKNSVRTINNRYDIPVSEKYKSLIISNGLTIENESRWLNAVSILCSMEDIHKLIGLHFVDRIEPVLGFKTKTLEQNSEVSPYLRDDFDYGYAQEQTEQINAHELHNQGFTGEGTRILVMDTGFDLSHNALIDINVVAQWDVIKDDNETSNETEEEQNINQDYHGTAVLSTIAAKSPGELVGIAFESEFLLAKTEDVSQEIQQEEDNYVAGLEWGEQNGADVVTTSLGYLDWYDYSDMDGNTAVTTIAVDIAAGLGVVCVTAAGNSGNNDWYYIIAPADADSVISVGAVSSSGQIVSFSSHGPTVDNRIKPEVCARGRQTWCVSPNSTTNYTQLSGTSLACPLVGGVAALIIQANPDWTAMEIRQAIMMTSSMSDSANNDYGHGIVNAAAAMDYNITSNIDFTAITPVKYSILKAYPNPFNPSLSIEIEIENLSHVKVDILSYNGNHIATIFDRIPSTRAKRIEWNPKGVSSGIYFVSLIVNGQKRYKKVTYIK
ncbi:MAG: T9SS C-terminal target domain-containing protein [bacterium TMED46]|nr:MAG: T9SS C-terminal target domain-containing protein [bacterium TMED46]